MTEEDRIKADEPAYRLQLTTAEMKIVHTALKSLYDDLGHDEDDVERIVRSVLSKLPAEDEIAAIDLKLRA